MESSMSKAGLDNQHHNKDGEAAANTETPLSARCAKFTDKV
jgi:hypothetical protein